MTCWMCEVFSSASYGGLCTCSMVQYSFHTWLKKKNNNYTCSSIVCGYIFD